MEKGLVLTFVLTIVFIITALTFSRARRMLESWAEESGYQILHSELRWLRRGPFFWTTSKNQVVYYVTIQTPDRETRSGWVRCGSWWGGILQRKMEVRWEDERL